MQVSKKKQDINVELLRIIACLMVIMIHVRPFPISGTTLRDAVVLIYVLNGPAVAAFFLISGFFISKSQSLSHVLKRFLTGVILPTAVFVFVLELIRPWIDHPDISLFSSILNSRPLSILSDMAQGFLAFDTVRFGLYADHLWYIFSYAGVMLWMPVILALVKHDEIKALMIILLIAVFHFTLQNLSALVVLPIGIYIPESIGKPAMYTVAGFLFYTRIKKIRTCEDDSVNKSSSKHSIYLYRLSFIILFVLCSVILFFLQKHIYQSGMLSGRTAEELNSDYYFTSWHGMICGLQTLALSGAVLLIPGKLFRGAAEEIIRVLGSFTFPVYLLHYVFTNHFRATGVEAWFKDLFGESSVGLMSYSLIYTLFIFAVTAILVFILTGMRKVFIKGSNSIKAKRNN
ncbi:hypothetical protein UYO_1333 [Lachnospiraceae bacterium JC7]|nr:hypothetical protein UYO_1333 [Lachnospiraceae bacterium JC7]